MSRGETDTVEGEQQDVFVVAQLTRGTPLESIVGTDLVDLAPHKESSMHRHNNAETVLYFTAGRGEVLLTDDVDAPVRSVAVEQGTRLRVGKGQFHAVRTGDEAVQFISVQSPPILDKSTGVRDLESIDTVNS